ncbi:MAG: DUF177 domain-containing protein [Myxococcota bacterium]
MASFVLKVPEIESKGKVHLSQTIAASWLKEALADTEFGAPEGFEGPLEVEARLVMDDILVEGRFSVALNVPCARCVEPIRLDLDGAFTQFFSRGVASLPEELELTPEDLDRETFSGEEIALDSFIREFILLEVPMAPSCDGQCGNVAVEQLLSKKNEAPKRGPLAVLGDLAAKLREEEN